jgi:type VI protein secretion system component Hcp
MVLRALHKRSKLMTNSRLRFSRHWVLAAAIALATALAPLAAAATTWLDLASTGGVSEFPTQPLNSKSSSWIEVSSYRFGVGKPAIIPRGGGRTAGPTSTESISVGIASNPTAAQTFFEDALRGTALSVVRVYIVKPSAKGFIPYYVLTLKNVLISSPQWSGSDGDEATKEEVTFEYGALEIQYNDGDKTLADPKSPIKWNIVQYRPFM